MEVAFSDAFTLQMRNICGEGKLPRNNTFQNCQMIHKTETVETIVNNICKNFTYFAHFKSWDGIGPRKCTTVSLHISPEIMKTAIIKRTHLLINFIHQ